MAAVSTRSLPRRLLAQEIDELVDKRDVARIGGPLTFEVGIKEKPPIANQGESTPPVSPHNNCGVAKGSRQHGSVPDKAGRDARFTSGARTVGARTVSLTSDWHIADTTPGTPIFSVAALAASTDAAPDTSYAALPVSTRTAGQAIPAGPEPDGISLLVRNPAAGISASQRNVLDIEVHSSQQRLARLGIGVSLRYDHITPSIHIP